MKKVKEFMIDSPLICGTSEPLQSVAKQLAKNNLDFLPVIDEQRRVIGIITDRDICKALGIDDRKGASDMTAKDVMNTELHACTPEENLETVLKIMRLNQIAYVLVVDNKFHLKGIVTFNSVVKEHINDDKYPVQAFGNESILKTLGSIARRNKGGYGNYAVV